MKTICLILVLFIFNPAAFSQETQKRKFSWCYLDLSYKHELYGNVKKGGKGFALETGLNAGRLFNKHTLITPYVGLGVLWGNKYSSDFLSDYSANYVNISHPSTYLADIVRAGGTEGDIQLYYGILFKLPYRYTPPMKIYIMSDHLGVESAGPAPGSVYDPQYGSGTLETLDRKGWGFETYLYSIWNNKKHPDESHQRNIAYISLFYERLNFKEAMLSDKGKFRDHASSSFMNKYGTEWKLGFKIGVSLM
ncbi:MAG TPA: hypothetical protein DCL44_06020 [Elusimicrobia bacterium]|nr:hypothetical protein [Elusimicrobiota bacterium]